MSAQVPEIPLKTAIKRSERGTFLPGTPGGPGHPKNLKNKSTLINEAKLQLCLDLLEAQPSKRFYKRWLKNYAVRHPKEALELIANITNKLEGRKKAEAHLHLDLAALVTAAGRRGEEKKSITS